MISVLGSANPFDRGMHRREVLRIGGLGALSLTLPQLLQLESQAAAETTLDSTFGRAKRIMLLYLQGAASQLETWDPKPLAPEDIRGEFGAISTLVPGTQICEKLPKLSQQAHRLALVRSMTHDNNNHSNLYTLSGFPALDFTSETNPFDSRHHPFFGSVIDYLADQQNPHEAPELPRNIGLPFRFTTYGQLFRRAGPYGAFLGSGYDPVWTEFEGKPTRSVPRVSFFDLGKDVHVEDPYLGITPESRLRISKDARLNDEMQLDRLDSRRTLSQQLEDQVRAFDSSSAAKSIDRFRDMAYTLMTSEKLRRALDVGEEPMELREQYGMTLFGQATLTGRRLLEAGCRLVSVFWDEYKVVNTAWDTHFDHHTRLGNELLPGFDAAVSSLLDDLDRRGMLDDTLVLCLTEHGRTSQIARKTRGGGRDHWSKVYSVMLAGGGVAPGIVGASDQNGAFVKERPVSPEDILATMYHLSGISPETTIPDRLGRPLRIANGGEIVHELLA